MEHLPLVHNLHTMSILILFTSSFLIIKYSCVITAYYFNLIRDIKSKPQKRNYILFKETYTYLVTASYFQWIQEWNKCPGHSYYSGDKTNNGQPEFYSIRVHLCYLRNH